MRRAAVRFRKERVAEVTAEVIAGRGSLTRADLEAMRLDGLTQHDVSIVAASVLEDPEARRRLLADLDSYGPWAPDG